MQSSRQETYNHPIICSICVDSLKEIIRYLEYSSFPPMYMVHKKRQNFPADKVGGNFLGSTNDVLVE